MAATDDMRVLREALRGTVELLEAEREANEAEAARCAREARQDARVAELTVHLAEAREYLHWAVDRLDTGPWREWVVKAQRSLDAAKAALEGGVK